METFYLNIEGRGERHPDSAKPFGFFVHCLVRCESLAKARTLVQEDLASDDLAVTSVHHEGPLAEFLWDDQALETRVRDLAREAEESPGTVTTSDFESWTLTSSPTSEDESQ